MLQTLTNEAIIAKAAPEPPYSIAAGEEDLDRFLKDIARGQEETISDRDFDEWYRQQVNESRLSAEEFRDLARINLLTRRLAQLLAENVPTVAEQVYINMIVVRDLPEARRVRERLAGGEGFADVARDASTDERIRAEGGAAGWYPRGALSPHVARVVFDELDIGDISEPLMLDDESFAIMMVSERAAARQIDEGPLERIRAGALQAWLEQEKDFHRVEFHGFNNGYDSETDAWVQWQLARMKRSGNRQ
jgi:foldase protein PrsA